MSDQIQLSELQNYLAYGLKVKRVHAATNQQAVIILDPFILSMWEDENYTEFKPLVRPLSELTDEQWEAVFFAGMAGYKAEYDKRCAYKIYVASKVAYLFNTKERDLPHLPNKYKELFHYNFRLPQFSGPWAGAAFNQLSAFNKLYEYHGDVHNLIERGLALSLTDFEKEKV